jgi:hypothetical protein
VFEIVSRNELSADQLLFMDYKPMLSVCVFNVSYCVPRNELSTAQVLAPVNTVALTSWAPHIPADVRADIDSLAPMLATLGYDAHAFPPDYGTPDATVRENTRRVQEGEGKS